MLKGTRADVSDKLWVDWERDLLLNFRDSERVVSLPNAHVPQVCV